MAEAGAQGRATIRQLLNQHGLSPRKTLGQHFLADPNIIRKVVDVSGVGPGGRAVEIGGGTGTLTAELAASGATVVVYEIDRGLVGVLDEVVGDLPNVKIRCADAARLDLGQALEGGGWVMVANLPYNVGTGILLDAVRTVPKIERFVVMVQSEVAERLFAGPGSKAYGVPSVITALYTDGAPQFTVGPDVFYPKPQVGSTVVALDRIEPPPRAKAAVDLAAAAFQQRRKMLRRSLDTVIDDPEAALRRAGIDPTVRAEEVEPLGFVRLADEVAS